MTYTLFIHACTTVIHDKKHVAVRGIKHNYYVTLRGSYKNLGYEPTRRTQVLYLYIDCPFQFTM